MLSDYGFWSTYMSAELTSSSWVFWNGDCILSSSNSTWLLVGNWLFCLQYLPCSVSFWCMLGGSVEILKNILYGFYKVSNSYWGANMSLALDERKYVPLCSSSNTTYKHAPQVERNNHYCMQNTKSPTPLKDNCNVLPIFCQSESQGCQMWHNREGRIVMQKTGRPLRLTGSSIRFTGQF